MKTIPVTLTALTGVVLGCLPLTTAAEQNRFYLQADAGGSHARDVRMREFFGQPGAVNSTISLESGIRLGLRGGYGLTDFLAAELETGITANRIDRITGAAEADGSIANVPLLLNLRLHGPDHWAVAPYAGAGMGFSSTILTGDDIVFNTAGTTRYSGSSADAVFAYQAFAGFRVAINDHMSVGLAYNFFHANASTLRPDFSFGAPPSDRVRLGRTESHSITATFTYRF